MAANSRPPIPPRQSQQVTVFDNPLLGLDLAASGHPLGVSNTSSSLPSSGTSRSASIVALTPIHATTTVPTTNSQPNTGDAVIAVSGATSAAAQPTLVTEDPEDTREIELDESLFSVFPYDWCGLWEWPMLLSGYLVQFLAVAMLIAKSEKTQCNAETGGEDWDTVVARIVMWFILVLTVFQDFQNAIKASLDLYEVKPDNWLGIVLNFLWIPFQVVIDSCIPCLTVTETPATEGSTAAKREYSWNCRSESWFAALCLFPLAALTLVILVPIIVAIASPFIAGMLVFMAVKNAQWFVVGGTLYASVAVLDSSCDTFSVFVNGLAVSFTCSVDDLVYNLVKNFDLWEPKSVPIIKMTHKQSRINRRIVIIYYLFAVLSGPLIFATGARKHNQQPS